MLCSRATSYNENVSIRGNCTGYRNDAVASGSAVFLRTMGPDAPNPHNQNSSMQQQLTVSLGVTTTPRPIVVLAYFFPLSLLLPSGFFFFRDLVSVKQMGFLTSSGSTRSTRGESQRESAQTAIGGVCRLCTAADAEGGRADTYAHCTHSTL